MSLTLPAAAGTVLAGTNNSSGQHQAEIVQGLAARYNEKILDTTLTWANSAASGTVNTASVAFGSDRVFVTGRSLLVVVRNPGAVVLNGVIQTQYVDNVTTRYAKLVGSDFTISASNGSLTNGDGESYLVDGGIMAAGIRIWLANATAVGGAGTFAARVVVYHL